MLSHVGPILGLYWARLGLCWAMLGPSWAHVGPMLGPCWPMLGLCWPMLSPLGTFVGALIGPSMLKRAQNHVKTDVFLTSPRWKSLPLKGPKHRKKRCVLTPQAKYAVNYRGFSGSGVGPGWAGGGSAAGGAAPITFGYYRRPPARTRARGPRPDLCECGNPQHKPKMAPWARLGPPWAP